MSASSTAPRDLTTPPAMPGLLGFSRGQGIALVLLVAFLLAGPFILYPVFLMKLLCFALFACAFNLLIGYVGLLSFGHAAFFGMGGYLAAHAAKVWGLTPEISILAGGVVGAVLGLLFGWLAIRRQGIYFAMITLALAQMVFFFCLQAPFTHGEDGIQSVPRGRLFGLIDLSPDMTMYWLVAAVFLIGFLLIHRIVHSPFGQVLKAIRENEPRATSLGYRADDYKLMAFVLSAALSGVAGGTKALVFGIATLTDVHWSMSGEVVLMTLLGGLGTLFGPVVGASVIVAMQNYLAPFGAWVTVIQGAIFVVCVVAFRAGIVGEIGRLLKTKL
ncbi:branched-chain amino acid ABC transporter permease [Roseomonas gilardii]|uniref:ABC transporter permease n=1 Tax=Roseomonas gilardii TaxID=257708 RepID=A0A1L7AI26_9PROT|nr:branched-chain amino acid ABC transporter permease [Roseomonas gilardii]APT58453.1 ABC transporter permease [Roseomonas gilardii]MDT8330663.1 branched-chain amino acid ABC transporter permease [Roseomonas gilardii]PZR14769.1 MAG: branched-chain amino acid ABC transporter permease [Azospirillum brasilense]